MSAEGVMDLQLACGNAMSLSLELPQTPDCDAATARSLAAAAAALLIALRRRGLARVDQALVVVLGACVGMLWP
jgi:hypothetical protein